MAVTQSNERDKIIRKLRKKIRQIENLELLDRELNDEELDKIRKKAALRKELAKILGDEMKRPVPNSSSGSADEKVSPSKVSRLNDPESLSPSDELELSTVAAAANPTEDDIHQSSSTQPTAVRHVINSHLPKSKSDSKPQSNGSNGLEVSTRSVGTSGGDATISSGSVTSTSDAETGNRRPDSSLRASSSSSFSSLSKREKETASSSGGEPGKKWRKMEWEVEEYEGHEDLVLDCDLSIELGLGVTCSRDTTVKVWSLSSGSLIHSLRGHTSQVTGVKFIPRSFINFSQASELDVEPLLVSGSQDCSIKIWNGNDGVEIRSHYTYNGITVLTILPSNQSILTGTDGGKLEMFSLETGASIYSQRVHDEAVTAVSVRQSDTKVLLASGSQDGIVKVFEVAAKQLKCLYVSENVTAASPNTSIHVRPIYSLTFGGNSILYYGDDGCNIKSLHWRINKLRKIANHSSDVGFTDAISTVDNLLISTTYDIDSGRGGLNLFHLSTNDNEDSICEYLATITDNCSERISGVCAKASIDGNGLVILTVGQEIKVWKSKESAKRSKSRDSSTSVRGCVRSTVTGMMVADSGTEHSDENVSDSDSDADIHATTSARPPEKSAGFCNCSVM